MRRTESTDSYDPYNAIREKVPSAFFYKIVGGKVGRGRIPEGGYVIPEDRGTRLLPGEQSVTLESWSLKEMAAITHRILPWFSVYVSPKNSALTCSGYTSFDGYIYVTAELSSANAISTVFHEIWHAAERELPAFAIDSVNACVESGPDYASDYYNSLVERRARAFQHYALTLYETGGFPMRAIDVTSELTEIFSLVLTGRLAASLAVAGRISDSELHPEILAIANQMRAANRKATPPVERIAAGVKRIAIAVFNWIVPPKTPVAAATPAKSMSKR